MRLKEKWVADLTYIWSREGWLYVVAVMDLYSRRIIGCSMHSSMSSQLVLDAPDMEVSYRGRPNATIHHSDQRTIYKRRVPIRFEFRWTHLQYESTWELPG
jgi:putative transposase